MFRSFKNPKDALLADPGVITNYKQFINMVKPGMLLWEIGEISGSNPPNWVAPMVFRGYTTYTKYGQKYKYTYLRVQFTTDGYIDDLFWGTKCVCLTENKAKQVLEYFTKTFLEDVEWQLYVAGEALQNALDDQYLFDNWEEN